MMTIRKNRAKFLEPKTPLRRPRNQDPDLDQYFPTGVRGVRSKTPAPPCLENLGVNAHRSGSPESEASGPGWRDELFL